MRIPFSFLLSVVPVCCVLFSFGGVAAETAIDIGAIGDSAVPAPPSDGDEDGDLHSSFHGSKSDSDPSAEGYPDITGDTVLDFLEHVLGVLKEEEEYRMGAEWRNADGSFKSMRIEPPKKRSNKDGNVEVLSVQSCSSLTGVIDGSDQGSVSYEYGYCTGSNFYGSSCYGRPLEACVYIYGNYDRVNMNYNSNTGEAQNKDVSLGGLTGATCSDCYAYVGANMGFMIYCTTTYCTIDFEAGGGAKANVDLAINDPIFTSQSSSTPLSTPLSGAPNNIPDQSYNTLAQYNIGWGSSVTVAVATELELGKFVCCLMYDVS